MSVRRRLATIPRRLESQVANPLVAAILRSRFHPLLSRWLLLLAHEGRRSGRHYTTPILYRRTPDGVVLVTPAGATNWWRNFRGGHPVSVRLQGEWHGGEGEVVSDEEAILEHFRWLVGPIRRLERLLGRAVPSEAWLERAAQGFVLVRVNLGETSGSVRGDVDADRREQ